MRAPLSLRPTLRFRGMGFALPGAGGICERRSQFWDIVREGRCCLTPFHHPELALRVAGQVHGWDPTVSLGIPQKLAARYSRVSLLAAHAVVRAMEDAGLGAAELCDDRTVLAFCSLQFAAQHLPRYADAYTRGGWQELGIDYWVAGTPASITSIVSNVLGIECPTLLVSGSCNVGARCLQSVHDMFWTGQIDRAIVVGADCSLDPIFLSGCCYTSRQGYRPSTLSEDPSAVRPHDELQDGNAPGEGAVAVILEADEPGHGVPGVSARLFFHTSRCNGHSPMASGPPQNIARNNASVLAQAGIELSNVAFANTMCEGARWVEDYCAEAMERTRDLLETDARLLLTNQEAAFGHTAGATAIVKILANLLMQEHGQVGPAVHCLTPYARLRDVPVVGGSKPVDARHSLVVAGGAGGDSTSVLLELVQGAGDA